MSFTNFDDINEICCGMIDEEERLRIMKEKLSIERVEPTKRHVLATMRPAEESASEDVNKEDSELVQV